MTTPNQPKPSTLDTLLGIGSFQVDNGGSTNYGQGIDDGFVKSLFEIPLAGFDNMLAVFADILKKLPGGALDQFTSIIPGLNIGEEVGDAVDKILAALDPRQIPVLIDQLLQMLNPGTTASGADGLAAALDQIKSMLGNPLGLGTNDFDLFDALKKMLNLQEGAGLLTSNTPIPANLLSAIAPGSDSNVVQDGTFDTAASLQGQGRWVWDMVGGVRTVRPGMTTLYFVVGTYQNTDGGVSAAIPVKDQLAIMLYDAIIRQRPLDLENIEVVSIYYPGVLFPMGDSIAQGKAVLMNLINTLTPPGNKFIMFGGSQGGHVISDVYDEIRHGSLQHRNADFLAGIALGNPRRQQGHTFTDPVFGLCPDPNPGGAGVSPNRLVDCEDRWWELALPGDFACDVSLTSSEGHWQRVVYDFLMGNSTNTVSAIIGLIFAPWEFFTAIQAVVDTFNGPGGPHSHYDDPLLPPFAALGDTRTYIQTTLDFINSFGEEPLALGEEHMVENVVASVVPGQVVIAKGKAMWWNLPDIDGDAIQVGVNVYNAAGVLIQRMTHADATISNPDHDSGWEYQQLSASHLIPAGAATARLFFRVAPEFMKTGIVWVDDAEFNVGQVVDAGLLGNFENMVQLLLGKVEGPSGMGDLSTAMSRLIDGLGSALIPGAGSTSGLTFADLFQNLQTLTDSHAALQAQVTTLSVAADPTYETPTAPEVFKTPGTVLWALPAGITTGDALDCVGVGSGGGGGNNFVFGGAPNQGGSGGLFNSVRLVYGTDIPNGTTQLSVTVPDGGNAQTNGASAEVKNGATLLLVCSGGKGGNQSGNTNPGDHGLSPGDFNFQDQAFYGGDEVANANPGLTPGGGGAGAGTFQTAGVGAPGAVWITYRKHL